MKYLALLFLLLPVPTFAFDLLLLAPRIGIEPGTDAVTMIWGPKIMLWDTDEMEWTP